MGVIGYSYCNGSCINIQHKTCTGRSTPTHRLSYNCSGCVCNVAISSASRRNNCLIGNCKADVSDSYTACYDNVRVSALNRPSDWILC